MSYYTTPQPITFTDEEIDELIRKVELDLVSNSNSGWNSNYGWEYDDWDSPPPTPVSDGKCKHEWIPSLLLTSTVYDCKHCGIKKEDADETK